VHPKDGTKRSGKWLSLAAKAAGVLTAAVVALGAFVAFGNDSAYACGGDPKCPPPPLAHNPPTQPPMHGPSGGSALGLIAVNNVANNNSILSNNQTNACIVVALCAPTNVQVNKGGPGWGAAGSGGNATGLIAVNNVANNNSILSNNQTNACIVVALCAPANVQVNSDPKAGKCCDGPKDPKPPTTHPTPPGQPCGCEGPKDPPHPPSKPTPPSHPCGCEPGHSSSGGSATGLIAVNNVGNGNSILSNNQTNVCGVVVYCSPANLQFNTGRAAR
jgi:hypothetical protein